MTEELINKVINEEINPALADHNGFVLFAGMEGNKIIVSFHGQCSSCSSSRGRTLLQIQYYMREYFENQELIVENVEFTE
tara:strand:+ start:414 stop:653 length:240 start_codon:yes stop_codon:yes gene_type:complete